MLSLLFCTTTFNSHAKRVEIYKRGGEGNNYDRVKETHTMFLDRLSCVDPGSTDCGWTAPIIFNGGHNSIDIEKLVEERVDNGNNSGFFNYHGEVYVNWTYDRNTDELLITMDDRKN